MSRHGQVIRLKPGKLEEYKRYHAEAWPGVLDMISNCNIHNYSIFHKDGFLFAYFEYTGKDFAADMAKIGFGSRDAEMVGHHEPNAGARGEQGHRGVVG